MAGTGWETASRPRHAELVSASMAEPLTLRCAEGNGRPWTLKQVQGDDEREAASGRFPTFLTPDEEWRFHRRSSRDPRRRAGLRALECRRCAITLSAPAFAGNHVSHGRLQSKPEVKASPPARKSGVEGKSWSECVDIGG